MATIQILTRETLSSKKYPLQMITYEKPGLDGVFHEKQTEVYFRPDAVAVLLADEQHQKFLLTKQFRLPAFLNGSDTGYLVEACAGIMDEGETEEQTVQREVGEETGYQVGELTKIGGVYTSVGGSTEFVHLFIGNFDISSKHGKGGGKEGEGEDIELVVMDFNDAREKLKQGWFIDAKTILLLQHWFLNNAA